MTFLWNYAGTRGIEGQRSVGMRNIVKLYSVKDCHGCPETG